MTATSLLSEPEIAQESPPPPRRRLVRRLVWGAVTLVLLVVVAGWVLFFSPWLDLRKVAVEQRGQIPETTILTAAALAEGTPLASLDTAAVEQRVAQIPAVAEVRVTREWPHGVTIAVTPRTPVGYAVTSDGSALVDRAGVRYESVSDAPADLPQLQAPDGQPTQDAVAVAAALPDSLRQRVSSVVVTDGRIRLTLRGQDSQSGDGQSGGQSGDGQSTGSATAGDGQSSGSAAAAGKVDESGGLVYWGTAEDSEIKAKVLSGLLAGGGDYKFFDVATPGYPTAGPSVPDATARVMGLPAGGSQSSGGSEGATTSSATTG